MMLKSVERLLEFVGDMNENEVNDHIKARPDGIAVSFRIDNEWLDGIVLGMMNDADRLLIEAKYGMCADVAYDKVFARLDTPPADMACEGESWTLA